MLIPFTDTVFGNGRTPDYLLLGNMVYTVSAPIFLTVLVSVSAGLNGSGVRAKSHQISVKLYRTVCKIKIYTIYVIYSTGGGGGAVLVLTSV